MVEIGRTHARLLAGLVEERERAGFSGNRLAAALGWAQSTVSRIETGARRPRPDLVRAWLEATGAQPERIAELVELAEVIGVQTKTWSEAYAEAGSAAAHQASYGATESAAKAVTVFQPLFVPSLAQTPEYARWLLSSTWVEGDEDVEARVEARMSRRVILRDPDKAVTLLILEQAVTLRVVPDHILAAQLDWLEYLTGLATIRVGIVPAGALLPQAPQSAVYLYEFDAKPAMASIELNGGQVQATDPEEVAKYRTLVEQFEQIAAFGSDAAEIIGRLRAEREG